MHRYRVKVRQWYYSEVLADNEDDAATQAILEEDPTMQDQDVVEIICLEENVQED